MKGDFAERYGYTEIKTIQLESMDDDLRMRLFNFVINCIKKFNVENTLRLIAREYFIIDGRLQLYKYEEMIEYEILKNDWYRVYSFIEFVIPVIKYNYKEHGYNRNGVVEALNDIFDIEKAAYKYLDGLIVPISNEQELKSISETIKTKYDSVNTHMKKALGFYSNRENPDYENSIKESISAVEALCCIIVGKDNAVLSSALDKLTQNGVKIHRALIDAFKKLYGYTSDENGIRHAGIEFVNASSEDAKYMLVSCSSFINYLIEKYEN
jgi:hypothetical protein